MKTIENQEDIQIRIEQWISRGYAVRKFNLDGEDQEGWVIYRKDEPITSIVHFDNDKNFLEGNGQSAYMRDCKEIK